MAKEKGIGIRAKVIIMMAGLGVVALILIGIASYSFSMRAAMNDARAKGELITNYIFSSRKYFHEVQRPLINELIEKDRFYPELMSEFVIAAETWDIFKENLPGYQFKQAGLKPLQPANTANEDEAVIIKAFQADPGLRNVEGMLTKDGEKYFYMARPIIIESEKCLRCHGDPTTAPKDQVVIYGTGSGYNLKLGDIHAADIVYIPIRQAQASVLHNALLILLVGGGLMVAALLVAGVFLNLLVVKPLLQLTERTEEISLGKNLERQIELRESGGEIGTLAQAIDRLRVSMMKMLSRRK